MMKNFDILYIYFMLGKRGVTGVGITIMMGTTIVLPGSSKEKMTCIHWNDITPNLILILLTNGKTHKAMLCNLHFTIFVEPL